MLSCCRRIVPFLSAVCLAGTRGLELENPSFELGDTSPSAWTASAGESAWESGEAAEGTRSVSVTGDGNGMNYWRSSPIAFVAGKSYAVSFWARSFGTSGGTPVSGPVFCNVDLGAVAQEWEQRSFAFTVPGGLAASDMWLRFGQWHVAGRIGFDALSLYEVIPVYASFDSLELGEGERITDRVYTFNAPLGSYGRNGSRPLLDTTCGFNSNRWVFGANSEVTYRHHLESLSQVSAKLEITVNYYQGGELLAEVSKNGSEWYSLASLNATGTLAAALPEPLFPAENIWVKLKAAARRKVGAAESDPGSFQVNGYHYEAELAGTPPDICGNTSYVMLEKTTPELTVDFRSFGNAMPETENQVVVEAAWHGTGALDVTPRVRLTQEDNEMAFTGPSVRLSSETTVISCPFRIPGTGKWHLSFSLGDDIFLAGTVFDVPEFYSTAYGELLNSDLPGMGVWWADSGWKIPRTRPLPTATGKQMQIRAARGETEAAQLVLRPEAAVTHLRLEATPFSGPGNVQIPAEAVEILRVYYHSVTRKTDATGVIADWPDALPPCEGPVTLTGGMNQPFWIRVNVPHSVPRGFYTGNILLDADGHQSAVPLGVQVYDFDLPERMTCSSAFGFSFTNVVRYQGLKTEEDKRQVLDKYLRNFSEHHISPYDPAPMDPFRVDWPGGESCQGGMRDRENPFAGLASLKLDDTSEERNVSARYPKLIDIPPGGFRLHFAYRCQPVPHQFIVTLNHYDREGRWLSGKNNDMPVTAETPGWQTFDRTITAFPATAAKVALTLWATRYSEAGTDTGSVWYDELSLTDLTTGTAVIDKDSFEPIDPSLLAPRFDWDNWDRAMQKAIGTFHFNSFRLPIRGLGGGTFHARTEPSLLGYAEDTPEYQAAFSRYLGAIQEHLRANGWLDEAYVYWFDEPDRKDYPFVMNGFAKLKRYAPDLRRMLTEQVEDDLIGGPNLWCPVSSAYDHTRAEARRLANDDFWWYVCTGPKAPYCTLFIDHPGTELRVWLWQTWQYGISGTLVWQSNFWTSGAAYPDPRTPQNPYLDPMGWVSGYDTPPGTKRAWGNGDGRFIYPPLAAADASPAGPVIDGPVDSIRWEMLRDGIEDYEYHVILRRLIQAKSSSLSSREWETFEALLTVPADISGDMTHFTRDPGVILERRHELAMAVEKLQNRP